MKYLVTPRGILLMETGLLHDYFGNFSMQGENYYFCMEGSMQGETEPMPGEIEMNIGKLRNLENSNFLFGWRGPLVMTFDGMEVVGVRRPDGSGW